MRNLRGATLKFYELAKNIMALDLKECAGCSIVHKKEELSWDRIGKRWLCGSCCESFT